MLKKAKKMPWINCVMYGALIAIALMLLLNIGAAKLVTSERVGEEKMASLSSTVCLISGIAGGAFAAKKTGAKILIAGACAGGIASVLIVMLSLTVTGKLNAIYIGTWLPVLSARNIWDGR